MDPWKEKRVIGNATLYLGDCLEILPHLPKVDAVITDPPYGLGFAAQPTRYQRINGLVACAWDSEAPETRLFAAIALARCAAVWGGNYFRLPPSRGWLVWIKEGNAPSMADLEMAWTSMDKNARWIKKSVKSASLEKDLKSAAHPTQKAVMLMDESIRYLEMPDVVLDPFMGSGTTGVACMNLGRKFIGIEICEKYYNIAVERITNAQRQQPLFAHAETKDNSPTQVSLLSEGV